LIIKSFIEKEMFLQWWNCYESLLSYFQSKLKPIHIKLNLLDLYLMSNNFYVSETSQIEIITKFIKIEINQQYQQFMNYTPPQIQKVGQK